MRILFVCTANVCRSVMAEAVFERIALLHQPTHPIEAESAGVDALIGRTPDVSTVSVCRARGLDVSSHTGRLLTREMIDQADIVLCMAEEHKALILSAYPRFKEKVFLLLEYGHAKAPRKLSVEDPTGRSLRRYEKCLKQIETEVLRVYNRIVIPAEGIIPTIAVSS